MQETWAEADRTRCRAQVIWTFFRVWALLDGVETVDNMGRCVNNNFTLQGAWRGDKPATAM